MIAINPSYSIMRTSNLCMNRTGAVRQWQWHFLCIERTTGHPELAVRCQVSYLHFCLCAPRWDYQFTTATCIHQTDILGVLGNKMRSFTRNQNLRMPCHVPQLHSSHSGFVYFGSENGKMYALNELTGEVVWTYDAFSPIRSPKVLRSISDLCMIVGLESQQDNQTLNHGIFAG